MKTIEVKLDAVDINRACRELDAYLLQLQQKTDELRRRIAEEVAESADFSRCLIQIWSYTQMGGQKLALPQIRTADVRMEVREDGNISTVLAVGEDAIWCEFGTGVYHNGSVGASPHPLGTKLGYVIGGYGKGRGRQQVWSWRDGDTYFTRGIPAYMPLYNAWNQVIHRIADIAREVFA